MAYRCIINYWVLHCQKYIPKYLYILLLFSFYHFLCCYCIFSFLFFLYFLPGTYILKYLTIVILIPFCKLYVINKEKKKNCCFLWSSTSPFLRSVVYILPFPSNVSKKFKNIRKKRKAPTHNQKTKNKSLIL